jgi:hypothetical protein
MQWIGSFSGPHNLWDLRSRYTEGSRKMYSLFECSHHTGHTDRRIRSTVRRHRRCLAADGGHFEHIRWLSLSPRKNCNYMSFCSKVLTIKEWVHFFGPLCILSNPVDASPPTPEFHTRQVGGFLTNEALLQINFVNFDIEVKIESVNEMLSEE